jgi:hypothetical protein
MRAQASERGSYSVYPSRRRLRGSMPIVRHYRPCKGQRSIGERCAVKADGKGRGIALSREFALQ